MAGTVQRIVEVIGEQTDRPVLVEDPALQVIAYSEHAREVDTVRRNSILERHTTSEVVAWCRAAGVHVAREPVRVQRNGDLDFLPRVCVPVYFHDLLLGFVWFIDDTQSLTNDDLMRIDGELHSLSAAMYEEHFRGELTSSRERAAAGTLLMDDPGSADHAAQSLLRDGIFEADGPTAVLVARFVEPTLSDAQNVALERGLAACRNRIGAHNVLTFMRGNHGALLIRAAVQPNDVAARLHADLVERMGEPADGGALVGVGATKGRLAEAPAAYLEAQRAARIASLVTTAGPVAEWRTMGVYRALSRPALESADIETIHPGLENLLDGTEASERLIETLETYLDSAGNASATSAALHLHRTTLYYRLQRIEELAETDLKDGDERLCLHLALKLRRLQHRTS